MATQRRTRIFLLLLVCVASGFGLDLGDTLRSGVDDLERATGEITLNGLPQICLLTVPIAGAFQNLYNDALVPTRALGLNDLLDTVYLPLTGNLGELKRVNNLPQLILSTSQFPTGFTDAVFGERLASGLPELSGFTIRTLDGTLGGTVDETLDMTLGRTVVSDVKSGLNFLPGTVVDLKSDAVGAAYTTGNILLDPVEDLLQQVESALTVAGVPADIL